MFIVPTSIPSVLRKYKPYGYKNVSMFKYKQTVVKEKQQEDKRFKERAYTSKILDLAGKYHD